MVQGKCKIIKFKKINVIIYIYIFKVDNALLQYVKDLG